MRRIAENVDVLPAGVDTVSRDVPIDEMRALLREHSAIVARELLLLPPASSAGDPPRA